MCKIKGGNRVVLVDGFYVETAVCTIIGIIWFCIFKNILKNVQAKSRSQWLVKVKEPR